MVITPFPCAHRLQALVDDGAGNISGARSLMICETPSASITSKLSKPPTPEAAYSSRGLGIK
jgi:hypothetical protein